MATISHTTIRTALLAVLPEIDRVMLGVCANNWSQGIVSLQQYSQALSVPLFLPTPEFAGPVYLKSNPNNGTSYASAYPGNERGVLLAVQSDTVDKLNAVFGHLPLDLFAPAV